ncbi:DegT/DnrJ/EryC1/StrS family aminotransferase [Streptomyces tricolor]|nr:DegT/DnrJ/EryC1/StrS family aminotransferase [Streptomyces tricolor]
MRLNEFSRRRAARPAAPSARPDRTARQRWALLSRLLGAIDGVVPQGGDVRADQNTHYMAMFRIPGITEADRNALVDRLVDAGLPAFAAFRAIYRTDAFWETGAPDETVEQIAERCPNTEAISSDCVWLHHRVLLCRGAGPGDHGRDHRGRSGRRMSVRAAVVGLGWAGRELWLPRLRSHPDFDVVAVVDPRPRRPGGRRRGDGHPAHAEPDALDPRSVDLAVVAVPNHLHTRSPPACSAGACPSSWRSRCACPAPRPTPLAAAERDGGVLLAGSAARHRADVRELAAALPELGRVRHVDLAWMRARGVPRAGGWFTRRSEAGGGALVDLGWHLVDTLTALLGPSPVRQGRRRRLGRLPQRRRVVRGLAPRAAPPPPSPVTSRTPPADSCSARTASPCPCAPVGPRTRRRTRPLIRIEGSAGTAELALHLRFQPKPAARVRPDPHPRGHHPPAAGPRRTRRRGVRTAAGRRAPPSSPTRPAGAGPSPRHGPPYGSRERLYASARAGRDEPREPAYPQTTSR